jgi:hypothetical protein
MKSARLIGFILAAMLLVNSFLGAPALAQQDEAAALTKRVGKFSEAIPLAQRALTIVDKALGPEYPNVWGHHETLPRRRRSVFWPLEIAVPPVCDNAL